MQLTRATQYAILAAAQLEHGPGLPTPCSDLVKLGGMPERFLLQVLRRLVDARLLVSTRGVFGGYRLAKPATEISLLAIVDAIDPPAAPDHGPLQSLGRAAAAVVTTAVEMGADEYRERLEATSLQAIKAVMGRKKLAG